MGNDVEKWTCKPGGVPRKETASYIQIKDWLPLEGFLAFVKAREWSPYGFPGRESQHAGPSSAGTESGQ